ncbi:hypothetical protein EDD11_000277 [Mortierella claussenii]|nr:hypothetical protein EDD11_000277 [Mortierella claussenii]
MIKVYKSAIFALYNDGKEGHFSESRMTNNKLELSILLPKERHQRQHIRKSVVVLPHTDPQYCPVTAFQENYRCIAHVLIPVPHCKDQQQVFIPLARIIRDL